MKILITTDWYRPVINGVVTSVLSLCSGLTALGHEVRVLTLSGDHHSRVEGNVTYLGSISVGMIYPNARLKTAPSGELVRALIDWRPDIVHSQCEFSTFFLARKIAEACVCPLIHTYHTVYEDFTHYFSPSVRLGRAMAALLSRSLLNRTDAVVAPTEKVREMLTRYGVRVPVAVIPTGLQLQRFDAPVSARERRDLRRELGLGEDEQVLLYLGRLAKEKNIEELLELLQGQESSAFKLLLVGDGPYRPTLEEKVRELGLESRVIFAGMAPPQQVRRYYALGDVFVSASRSETQGLTYIEAMAAGLPLLCREDECLEGVLRRGVTGFAFTTAAEFFAGLGSLADRETAARMGRAAAEAARRDFSSASFAGHMEELYCRCIYGELYAA